MGITNPSEEYFKDGSWGFDGSVWRKLPLIFGYTDNFVLNQYVAAAAAGTYTKVWGTVPAGEIWIVNSLLGINYSSVCSNIRFYVIQGGVTAYFMWISAPTANVAVVWNGSIVLKAGDTLNTQLSTCILNDVLNMSAIGYIMAVT